MAQHLIFISVIGGGRFQIGEIGEAQADSFGAGLGGFGEQGEQAVLRGKDDQVARGLAQINRPGRRRDSRAGGEQVHLAEAERFAQRFGAKPLTDKH